MKWIVGFLVIIIVLFSCEKGKIHERIPYILEIPSHFPDMIIPSDNPMTVEGVGLGRKLFYEKRLSGDNTMSCASCHIPSSAFSDPNQFSTGIDGIEGVRNSMALVNVGWNEYFFWDGRAKTLEEQVFMPVEDPIEMHDQWSNVVLELQADPEYVELFSKAFFTNKIDAENAAKAIAQFVRTMISGNSKFDVIYKNAYGIAMNSEELSLLATVTPEEFYGYDLFKSLNGADCFHCHNGPLMQVHKFSNNGLDGSFTDLGRGAVTGNATDNGKFKVPTLRNIEVSGPYMHDGRFATLDEVIEHYSSGVTISSTIDPLMEFVFQGGAQLDVQEKAALKAFLLTMTDHEFLNNPNFQEP